ncbi:MAG: DUF2142 domain-containing protein [Hespellia sp.]|nr:DUF2142 domain-containing protein [Hespellia sp.]
MKARFVQREKIIAIYIFIVGLCMSFAVPTWQTPDEYTHLGLIGSSIGVEDFAKKIYKSTGIKRERIEHNYDEKVDFSEFKAAFVKKPNYKRSDMLPKRFHLSVVKHLPSTSGILIGILMGVPAYWALKLGELFSLLFYSVVCYYSLKIIPLKKEVLAMIMLFPMAIHQAGSIGYDAVMIPLCFFLVAYIFYLKYEKESVGWKDMIIVILSWMLITYIKVPYVFLILLVLTIPLEKFDIRLGYIRIEEKLIKKIRIPVCILSVLVFGVLLYLFRANTHIQILYAFVTEWERGLYLLGSTGRNWTQFLMISTVGDLGWLDTPMSFKVVLGTFGCLSMLALVRNNGEKELKLRKWDCFIILGTFVLLCLFVTLSMVNHTVMVTLFGSEQAEGTYIARKALYQIPFIGGVQGRYYLPFISLLFLIIPQKIIIHKKTVQLGLIVFEFLMLIYIIRLLLLRYWIGFAG